MEKVYGNGERRAMRHAGTRRRSLPLRGLLLAFCVQFALLPVWAGTARASEMMLMEEQRRDTPGYGWLFVGLTLVAYGVAVNDYQESQDNIRKAKSAYSSYVASRNAGDAVMYRDLTNTYSHRAQAYESTANAALFMGTVLALTAIAIFRSDGKPDAPILLSARGIEWQYRF